MPATVYLETSILSALVDERSHPVSQAQRLITLDWWQAQRPFFDVVSSVAVHEELSQAVFPKQAEALKHLDELDLLAITPEIEGVAATYQKHLLMPRESSGDAIHLAVACVHEVDYLLTWNCKHLANVNKTRHIQVVNMRLGLLTPVILTPEMLVADEDEV